MSSPAFAFYTPTPTSTTIFLPSCQKSPTSPLSFSYLPQTPSPLRTSRNANIMPPPPTPTAPSKSSPLASVENVWNIASADENSFIFSPSFATTNSFSKESSFSQRARSQSPVTELGSRTSAARDRRKSLFLEQIRSRRENEKFEIRGDQLLRMDWARQEAERNARLARQAQRLTLLDTEIDEEEMMLDNAERAGPSPTEEKELEELIRLHEESQLVGLGQGEDDEDLMDDLDDEDYNQLFMEVISASQNQQAVPSDKQEQQQQQPGIVWNNQDSTNFATSVSHTEAVDETMDMS